MERDKPDLRTVAGNDVVKNHIRYILPLPLTKKLRERRLTLEQIAESFKKKNLNKETELIGLRGSFTTLIALRDTKK